MGELSVWHWLIVAGIFVVLFGSKRLPDSARSLGRSMRILKTEMRDLHDDPAEHTDTPPTIIAATDGSGTYSVNGPPTDRQPGQAAGSPPPAS